MTRNGRSRDSCSVFYLHVLPAAEIPETQETATCEFFVVYVAYLPFIYPISSKNAFRSSRLLLFPLGDLHLTYSPKRYKTLPTLVEGRDIGKVSPIICSRELHGSAKCSHKRRVSLIFTEYLDLNNYKLKNVKVRATIRV